MSQDSELLDKVAIDGPETETQTEEAPEAPPEETPQEQPEPSALATEPEVEPEKDDKPEPDKAQAAINKQYRLRREAEEAHERTRAELEEAQRKLAQARGDDKEPEVPPLPDPYDENYTEKMQARDKAIQEKSAWDARQEAYAEQQANQQREAYIAEQNALAQAADTYTARAQELGVNGESLQKASEVIVNYGISDDLVNLLLRDEDGPLMTQYLASDIASLDKLVRLPAIEVGQFIERELRPKAGALRPKTTETPAPPETLAGAGPGNDILGPHKGVVID